VRACRDGDDDAWKVLVNRFRRLVYGIAVHAGLDEDLAGEAFQRTFALLVEQLDRIERPDRIRAWLVTTASRESRRMRQRQVREPTAEPEPTLADDALLPDEVLLEIEERHVVRNALETLDPRCRELLRLLFYGPEAPPYADVAAQLGTSEGSIGPTRGRCLEKLRRELQAAGIGQTR
jgi:RNA polymerase sigma factor (sigma-70 family)